VRCEIAVVDVCNAAALTDAAARFARDLGPVTICVNNAGVGYIGAPADQVPITDYDWVWAVNFRGVIHGVRSFVPIMREAGMGGHVINVASHDGLFANPTLQHAPYCSSKGAVVLYSDALRHELSPLGIGVSLVCPGLVHSELPRSSRLRPAEYGGPFERPDERALLNAMTETAMDPIIAGRIIVAAIQQNRFWVLTHAGYRPELEARCREWQDALEWSERTASHVGVPDPRSAR
jgi:NAD(P)-dependent dehydrogenase (short-subunit alcohol dehydrogenase family)